MPRTTVQVDTEELDDLTRLTGWSRAEVLAAGLAAVRQRYAANRLIELGSVDPDYPPHGAPPAPARRRVR